MAIRAEVRPMKTDALVQAHAIGKADHAPFHAAPVVHGQVGDGHDEREAGLRAKHNLFGKAIEWRRAGTEQSVGQVVEPQCFFVSGDKRKLAVLAEGGNEDRFAHVDG